MIKSLKNMIRSLCVKIQLVYLEIKYFYLNKPVISVTIYFVSLIFLQNIIIIGFNQDYNIFFLLGLLGLLGLMGLLGLLVIVIFKQLVDFANTHIITKSTYLAIGAGTASLYTLGGVPIILFAGLGIYCSFELVQYFFD